MGQHFHVYYVISSQLVNQIWKNTLNPNIKEKKFPFAECHYEATAKQSLKSHINSKHRKVELNCDICHIFVAFYKKSIQTHKDKVHHKKKHDCELCCKKFDTKQKLKKHKEKEAALNDIPDTSF